MPVDRRTMLSTGLGAGFVAGLTATANAAGARERLAANAVPASADELGLKSHTQTDQSAALQAAIDEAANRGAPLLLPPGHFRTGALKLRPGTKLIATARTTTLEFAGGAAFLVGEGANGSVLEGLTLDGAYRKLDTAQADGLITLRKSTAVALRDLKLDRSIANGISLQSCTGTVSDCAVTAALQAGIFSLDAGGLEILHNTIVDCANNGIQIWRSQIGEDGTVVAQNRIVRIRADAGGTGENGNGVNVFRSGNVLVTGNRITDCAYSAVRGNAASDIQMIGNSCTRLGEVALYSEFGFQGALMSANVVDSAATGISITNFNDGGRLAVVQGNLIRNLFRREQEPEDKRGNGIAVEADTAVTGNVIENAPSAGITIGWQTYVRDVIATGNLIRKAHVGILVSSDASSRGCLIANNMISGTADGNIRTMDGAGKTTGPDLAVSGSSGTRLSVTGNLAV